MSLIEFRVLCQCKARYYLALVIRKRKFAWHFEWVFCSQLRVIARVQGARNVALDKRQIDVIHERMGPDCVWAVGFEVSSAEQKKYINQPRVPLRPSTWMRPSWLRLIIKQIESSPLLRTSNKPCDDLLARLIRLHTDSISLNRGYETATWLAVCTTREQAPLQWIDMGDLGYLDDEGNLFLTGRTKDIIILRSV